MRILKSILLATIAILLSSCTSNSESEIDLIKNHVTNNLNFGFDEDSLVIMETNDPDFKLAFLTNELGSQLITIYKNSVEGIHLVGAEEGPTDTPIYWRLSRNDQYEIMAGLIFDDNITNIKIDGVNEKDIKFINYNNVVFFFTSSKDKSINIPVTIECYDDEKNLIFTTNNQN